MGGVPNAAAGNNPLAIIGLICSILGLCCGIGAIIGIILGVVAQNQIKQTGQQGEGIAKAAIIIGVIAVVLQILYWIWAIATGGGYYRIG